MTSQELKLISKAVKFVVMGHGDHESTTELDSHANMAVVGKDVMVISDSGLHADLRSFSNGVPMLQKIPIVDVVVAYDDPYSMKMYILVIQIIMINLIP